MIRANIFRSRKKSFSVSFYSFSRWLCSLIFSFISIIIESICNIFITWTTYTDKSDNLYSLTLKWSLWSSGKYVSRKNRLLMKYNYLLSCNVFLINLSRFYCYLYIDKELMCLVWNMLFFSYKQKYVFTLGAISVKHNNANQSESNCG